MTRQSHAFVSTASIVALAAAMASPAAAQTTGAAQDGAPTTAPASPATAPDSTAIPLGLGAPSGSTSPVVVPADLDTLRKEGLMIPVAGIAAKDLIDSFDDKRGGTRTHNALDIMAARNTPVVAAVSGSIVKLHNSVAGGLTIYASDPSSKFVMMYGHLDSYRPGLKEGERVARGQIIGFVGSTGNANPTAPHLHFQITRNDNLKEWWKGTPVNPFPVFRPKG